MTSDVEIEPQALIGMMNRDMQLFLLDCREPWEHEAASIKGATLMPMREIPENLERIPKDPPVVVYCHHGTRSLKVTLWLRAQGVPALSLRGGIDRWSREIDPEVPTY